MALQWTAELNKRRFELIDGHIQGTLTPAEQQELEELTRLMRAQVETEAPLSFEGARKLLRHPSDPNSDVAEA